MHPSTKTIPRTLRSLRRQAVAAATELLQRDEPRRWIRLQARQGEPPLSEARTRRPIQTSELPISSELLTSLNSWSQDFERTFATSAAGTEGFESEEQAKQFVDRGRELARRIQNELGDRFHVEYYAEPVRAPGVRLR